MADLTGINSIAVEDLARLRAAGIHSTDILLKRCATPAQRQVLAMSSGISEEALTSWVNIADLFRVHGAGAHYVRLMVASGITSINLLASNSPDELLAKMSIANVPPKLVRQLPRLTTITEWIAGAKNIAKRVS